MTIVFQVMGHPGRDNALFVKVNSGQAEERLLFDCGERCLDPLSASEVMAIDHLFFSHLHIDHVAGFDSFFRCNFGRDSRPNHIWGPPGTAAIIQHRLRGYQWNLVDGQAIDWFVHDVHPDRVVSSRFDLGESFAIMHAVGERPLHGTLVAGGGFAVDVMTMDHRTPSLAFVVREPTRRNVESSRLAELNLRPGPWLKTLKEDASAQGAVPGTTFTFAELRERLVVETPGSSIAYLTDFLLDDAARDRLEPWLRGVTTVVCEGQYRHADLELAQRNYHMTVTLAAMLARHAAVGALILFHLSDRYQPGEWIDMLREARAIFPATRFSPTWEMEG